MTDPVGYSGKPLSAKLGIKPGHLLAAVDAPPHYRALVEPLPDGARLVDGFQAGAAITHLFVRDAADLAAKLAATVAATGPGCALWVSWPKKSSPLFVDLTEGGIRELVLPTGLVDVKVAAVDADWSGLKFLWRRA